MTCSWSRPNDPAMTLAACADIVAKGDPDRFRAVMSVPLAARERLLPLYAFNVEVARAPWVTEEPLIAEMRLQWWRDALDEIAQGGTVRRHEVVDPLAELVRGVGGAGCSVERHDRRQTLGYCAGCFRGLVRF